MRIIVAAGLLASLVVSGLMASQPARADYVPPFKGNDTGGIIAWTLASQTDAHGQATQGSSEASCLTGNCKLVAS